MSTFLWLIGLAFVPVDIGLFISGHWIWGIFTFWGAMAYYFLISYI